jgi:hypothetical protein
VQVTPLAELAVQSPTSAFSKTGRIVQAVETHFPEVDHRVSAQVAERVPTKPERHVGVHVVPEAELTTQSPDSASAMIGREAQAVLPQVPETVQSVSLHEAERIPANPESQTGVHVVPLAAPAAQFPEFPLEMAGGRVAQAVLAQVPVVTQTLLSHVAERIPENPELQAGTQVVPEAVLVTQVPAEASGMEGRVGQGWPPTAAQAPVVDQAPVVHVAERVPVKPVRHTGVHMVPEAELAEQSPARESEMVGSPEQGRPVQVPVEVQAPKSQVAERVPEYPVLQTGTQFVPCTDSGTQFPGSAFTIEGTEGQVCAQVPVVTQAPTLQVAERVPVYPAIQTGVHLVPEATLTRQSPFWELGMEGREEQAVEVQEPVTVHEAALHVAERVPA